MDIDNPPEEYFAAMRRLRLEPPDEETVERIVEIARRHSRNWLSGRGWGWRPLRQGSRRG